MVSVVVAVVSVVVAVVSVVFAVVSVVVAVVSVVVAVMSVVFPVVSVVFLLVSVVALGSEVDTVAWPVEMSDETLVGAVLPVVFVSGRVLVEGAVVVAFDFDVG